MPPVGAPFFTMNVCIFTVVKNEQDYLYDFLKYHTDMGIDVFVFEDLFSVSHFNICKQFDNVYLHSVIELYGENEIDELIQNRVEKKPPQTDFINRGLNYIHNLNKYDWCWLIDVDEYITSTEPFTDVLERFKDRDSVLVYWMNFGCSGHIYKPKYDKPIYDIYTERCGYELYSDYKNWKLTKFCVNMHKWKPTQKYYIHCANVNFIKADGTFKRTEIVYEPLYLRHYITKSIEEYLFKVYKRGMFHNGHRNIQSLWEMCPRYKEQVLLDKDFCFYINKELNINLNELSE